MSRFSKIKLATLVCAICLGFVVKKLDHYSAGDRIAHNAPNVLLEQV